MPRRRHPAALRSRSISSHWPHRLEVLPVHLLSPPPSDRSIDRDHGREGTHEKGIRVLIVRLPEGGKVVVVLAMVSANGGASSGSSEANSATASGPDLTMRTPPASAVENEASAPSLEFFNELEDSPMFKQQAVDLEQGSCRRRRRHNSYPMCYPPR